MVMALTIKDLRAVRNFLYPIRRKWYDIGIELGLDIDMLDTLKSMHSDPKDCLTEMLKVWLKSIEPPPTWTALGDALSMDAVGESEFAKKSKTLKLTI